MKTWLIAGGTGLIGTRMRRHLLQAGHRVVTVSRQGGPDRVTWAQLDSAVSDADVVLNLAGESVVGARWTPAVKERLVRSRLDTTGQVVEAIRRAARRPDVLINASAVGYYGDRADAVLTEDGRPADDFLADLCVRWEAAAKPVAALGVRLVLPRIGVVLDPAGGAMAKMKLPFLLFGGGPLGSGDQFFPWIHIDDLCRMIIWAASDPAVAGPLNAVGPTPVPMADFARAMGRAMGRPSWFPVPAPVIRLIAGEAAGAVLASQRVVPEKALSLGFTFTFTEPEPALRNLLA
jgi:uncharacterized protein (TIGR01777 family)